MVLPLVIDIQMGNFLGDLLKEWREKEGFTQAKAARLFGMGQPMVSYIEGGGKGPRREKLVRISEVTGIPIDDLLGRDSTRKDAVPLPAIRIITPYSFESDAIHEKTVDYIAVPVYEAAVVGGPAEEVHSERAKTVAFIPAKVMKGRDPQRIACFEVKGESMDPIIRAGAIVCVDLSIRPERSEIGPARSKRDAVWIVRKGNGLCIKHIRIKDSVIVLVSANPAEDVEVVTDPEAIVGKVFFVAQGL